MRCISSLRPSQSRWEGGHATLIQFVRGQFSPSCVLKITSSHSPAWPHMCLKSGVNFPTCVWETNQRLPFRVGGTQLLNTGSE